MELKKIKLINILENPYNPRDFEERNERLALNRLVESIREHGMITPLTVHVLKDGNGFYGMIAGHRRRRALLELGQNTAICNVLPPMTFREALPLILEDQEFTKPYTAYHKIKLALRGDPDIVPNTKAWRDRVYLTEKTPKWMERLILEKQLKWTTAYEIVRFAERVPEENQEQVMRTLVNAMVEGRVRRHHDLREIMRMCKDNPLDVIALLE